MTSLDSFKCCRTLKVGSKTYAYYSLPIAEKNGLKGISRLPFSLKVLLENLLRHEDGRTVTKEDIQAFATWLKNKTSDREVPFRPVTSKASPAPTENPSPVNTSRPPRTQARPLASSRIAVRPAGKRP